MVVSCPNQAAGFFLKTSATLASSQQFGLFVGVGIASTVVPLITRYLGNFVMPFEAAVALSQLVGALVAFALNRRFVFGAENTIARQLPKFLLVNVMSLIIATGTSSYAYR